MKVDGISADGNAWRVSGSSQQKLPVGFGETLARYNLHRNLVDGPERLVRLDRGMKQAAAETAVARRNQKPVLAGRFV